MSRLSRRGILGGVAALVPAVGVGATPTPASPDAELIAACDQHLRNLRAVNADGAPDCGEDHPLWRAYGATYGFIRDSRPQTMEGVLAKARAARAEAFVPGGEDEDARDWAGLVVRDLLRLAGG